MVNVACGSNDQIVKQVSWETKPASSSRQRRSSSKLPLRTYPITGVGSLRNAADRERVKSSPSTAERIPIAVLGIVATGREPLPTWSPSTCIGSGGSVSMEKSRPRRRMLSETHLGTVSR